MISRRGLTEAQKNRLDASRLSAAKRRERNREAGRCINDTLALTHGPATHGVCCATCREWHRSNR